MKKFTLLTAFVVLVSFAFAQVVGVHAPAKDKQKFEKVQKEENTLKVDPYVAWEVTFEETPAVWTIAHDEGDSDWIVSDSTITGVDYENGVDFDDSSIPIGTMVSSMWLYCGHRDVGVYSESGGNFAWIDGITDLLTGTEEIKNAWVQFDDIDLTNIDNPKLMFYQNYKALNQAFSYLDISTDGGQTFTQEVLLNDGVEGNSYGDELYEIILTDYIANESDVSLRFRWQTTEAGIGGYGYGWEVDDIKIVDNFNVDMKLQGIYMNFFEYIDYTVAGQEDYFHYSSHYGMIPIEQFNSDTAAMLFNAKVENGGNLDNTPELQVQVFDPTGTEVYNESATGALLSVTEQDTIDLLTPEFKPATPVVGKYTVIFNINVDGDENPDNNADTTFFMVTEDAFARDLGNMTSYTGPSAWLDGGVDGDMMGTDYLYLDDTDTITSMSVYIASNTDPGTSIVGHLLQYDADLEQWQDLMTTSLVNITEDSIGKWIDLEFPADVPVVLEEGSFSVKAAVEFFYSGENELMVGYDGTVPASSWGTTWYMNEGANAGQWYSISNWSRGGVGIRLNSMNEPTQTQANILTYTFPQHSGAPIVIDHGSQTVDIEVNYSADLSNLVATYNLSYGATATVGATEQFSGYTANDFTSPVTYTVLAQDSVTTKDWVVTVTKADPSAEAEIMNFSFDEANGPGVVDTVANTVDVEVAYGTDMTTLVANFSLSDYAVATVGGVTQISGETPNDFTSPVTYTITAQDGVTTQDYTVTVTEEPASTEAELLVYSIPEQITPAAIDDVNHTVDIDVPFGTDVTALVATFELSDDATAEVGGVVQESGVTANDFTTPVTYTVIAQDGTTTQDWIVTVTPEAANTGTDILTYGFPEQTAPAAIDDVEHTISVNVSTGTDVTALVATFTLSVGATAEIGGVVQESGVTTNDFSSTVTYTITAEDGSTTQDWVVTVTAGLNIEDMINADLTIHPNPTNGKVIVEMYLNQSKDVSLSIISTTGQVISHQEYKNVSEIYRSIDLGDVANGVYTLRIQADGKQLNRKIVLNK
ncbi:MAG: T9SS type A sorting domain-containing protein [Candidatus Delongbacteria bacterium]|jgi:hypothetical protein|nr:T9SS type A sorting domain-containing protein [Candidatus Delongbacteria bacterium]